MTVSLSQLASVLKQHQPEPTEAALDAWQQAAKPENIEGVIAVLIEQAHACTEPRRASRGR